jgi:hypothetical protein
MHLNEMTGAVFLPSLYFLNALDTCPLPCPQINAFLGQARNQSKKYKFFEKLQTNVCYFSENLV